MAHPKKCHRFFFTFILVVIVFFNYSIYPVRGASEAEETAVYKLKEAEEQKEYEAAYKKNQEKAKANAAKAAKEKAAKAEKAKVEAEAAAAGVSPPVIGQTSSDNKNSEGSTDSKTDGKADSEQLAIDVEKANLEKDVGSVFNQINTTSVSDLFGRLVNGALGILGSIALVMFVYGGILWMTAAGDSAKSEKAHSVILWASLGVAVIFASYAILKMVFEAVG